MAFTNANNQFGSGQFVVDPSGNGSYLTIQSAVNAALAAGSGKVVQVKPGLYTETITISPASSSSISITSSGSSGDTQGVHIDGFILLDVNLANLDCSLSGLYVTAGGSVCVSFEGGNAATLTVSNCYLLGTSGNCVNNAGVTATATFYNSTLLAQSTNAAFGVTAGQYELYNCSVTSGYLSTVSGTAVVSYKDCTVTDSPNLIGTASVIYSYCDLYPTSTNSYGTLYLNSSMTMDHCIINNFATPNLVYANAFGDGGTFSYSALTNRSSTNPLAFDPYLAAVTTPILYPVATAGNSGTAVRGSAGFDATSFAVSTTGFVSLAAGVGGLNWSAITANQTLAAGNGYFISAGALSLALPATSAVGDTITVSLLDTATSFVITQASAQKIRVGSTATTVGAGGSLASTAFGDSVTLVSYSNGLWEATSVIGSLTAV